MNSQPSKRAVQLIAFDKEKNPFIPEEALKVLSQMSSKNIHVIAVAGKYRTGKSYILNRVLLNKNNGFNVGHTINACTKGLWMWPELIKLGDKDCLIIDTEGLGSLQEGESTDLKIFMLALLFSSYLIYNSTGNIDQQAIQSLNLVIQLANVLQRQDRYDSQELVNTFPSFLWLLRDFSLQLVNEKGETLTPTDYLEQALKHQPKSTPAAERKNQIRKQLRTFFEHRDCFALVRPTEQQRDLQNLSSLPTHRLRPEFVKLTQELTSHITNQVKPKRVRGRVLSSDGFVQLCKYYTKALVDGKLPTITSHWDNLCLGQTHRIFQKYQLQHLKAIEQTPQDINESNKKHLSLIKEGLEAIDKSFLGKLEKQLFKQRFERKLEGQFQEFKIKISKKKNNQIRLLLDNIEDFQTSEKTIIDKYQKMMEKMSELSETNIKDDGLYCELFLYLSEHSRTLLHESEAQRFQFQAAMNEKCSYLEDQIANLKSHQQKIEEMHGMQLNSLRKNSLFGLTQMQECKQREKDHIQQILNFQQLVKELTNVNKNLVQQKEHLKELLMEKEDKIQENENNNKILEEKIQALDIELAKKEELIREDTIKLRKLFRQKQIVKSRYEEYLNENILLKKSIENLQQNVISLEKGYILKRSDSLESELHQMKKKIFSNENKMLMLQDLIQAQKNTYQTLLQIPLQQKYFSLQKNIKQQMIQKQLLQEKISEVGFALSNCQRFRCLLCKRDASGQLLLLHSKICQGQQTGIEFDVSYKINEGKMQYEIEITNNEQVFLIVKTEKQMEDFLLKIDKIDEIHRCVSQSQRDFEGQCEQKRAFIQQVLRKIDTKSLFNPYFIQFLQLKDLIKSNLSPEGIDDDKNISIQAKSSEIIFKK